ncbi:M4 family metallopeptidase [Emticicia agri]|uniref:T9SS type A sorting domain-containing protein n=1 Tax=Emticicia agri TaxID=2492393 RepID=A0A4Q5M113_9BACT|nr:M4 family metallopeptidase [Emticicia agri]RYU95533.1 T9SS type A sorting domain-containing protein [Emticicia agri]
MRLTFILLFFIGTSAFAQKGFERKQKSSSVNTHAPAGDFLKIQGEKTDKNTRQLSPKGLTTKFISKYKVTKDPETGRILMIENFSKPDTKARLSAQALATNFLADVKATLQIEDPNQELVVTATETDAIGMTHMQLQQKYKNIPIYGGEIWLHSKDNKIETLNGRNFPTPKLVSVKPQLTEAKAIELAMADVAKKSIIQKNISNSFITQGHVSELLIYHKDDKGTDARLTYYLTIRPNILERWLYFIDANTGEVLKKFNHTCALDGPFTANAKDLNNVTRTVNIQQFGGTYYMIDTQRPMYNKTSSKLPDTPVGGIMTIDAKNTPSNNTKYSHVVSSSGTSWSTTSVSAHHNAGVCYDYFRTKFNRNSLDGKGSTIISVINIADEDGKGMDNAYWNGAFMGYGNGLSSFKPLAGALDVAGHEMTHGVVEASARLEYQNQSGALNESFADIFGAMIDRDDWTVGEDVVKAGAFPSGALRSLQNPNQGGKKDPGYQPKNMSQYLYLENTEEQDNGGVHINSGIPNHAFYLFASNANVGKDKAELVYYRALTLYLTRTSKFVDARLAVVKAAADLYGASSPVVSAAKAAFDNVGIADPSGNTGNPTTPNPPPQTIPVNNGTDFILVFDPTNDNLYVAKIGDLQFKAISASGCLSKPSVTDDGQYAYFVGKDKNIRRIALTGTFKEDKLTSDAVWDNVAISKDGKRVAGLTNEEEPYMYVFDLENNGKSAQFKLYNPTYSSGVSTGEVIFADSFEWDYSGEIIIYDAFNRLSSVSGEIEYWDVGLIRVWDTAKKTFGDGKIEKLFTDLEEGESIGNPALSKNTQNVIAFDYYSSDEPDTYYQIGVDIETNDLDLIYTNNEIGYPGYSRLDDKLLFNALNDEDQQIVMAINLQKNKISPSGDAQEWLLDAKWAVWYAQGTRALPTKTDQTITFGTITDKAPSASFTVTATASSKLPVQYAVESGDATVNGNRITLGTKAGKVKIQAFQVGNSQFNSVSASQTFCILPVTPKITASGSNLVASGGTKYQWYLNGNAINGATQATITPTNAGQYTVKSFTEDGCASAFSTAYAHTVKSNQTITFGTISDKNLGAIFTVSATASSGLLLQYSIDSGDAKVSGNSVTCGTKAGKVTIKALQAGNNQYNSASATQTFCIVPAAPKITASSGNLVASGGTKYQWYLDGAIVNGATQATITPTNAGGIYTVRSLTDDGCSSALSTAFEVKAAILGTELDANIKVTIYPNPTSDELKIELPAGVIFREATFYTPGGIKAMHTNQLSANNLFNIGQLAKGMYILKIETSQGSLSRKIVRE